MPRSREARLYYQAAKQRFLDAELLLKYERTTGAVYLAGYTAECFLKALILASVAGRLRGDLLGEFRGVRGHSIEWLGAIYRRHVTTAIPREVTRHLVHLAEWSTDLRYETGTMRSRDADGFIRSVIAVAAWADGRM
ncbi:MAG: hypothetical protein HY000_17670 [Planctomycetes bacterium]|nr:hypothetical protein [Planctomycetota bacterium]